ncbi:hypothetical protein ACJX0J_015056, partial [Zea mays]
YIYSIMYNLPFLRLHHEYSSNLIQKSYNKFVYIILSIIIDDDTVTHIISTIRLLNFKKYTHLYPKALADYAVSLCQRL